MFSKERLRCIWILLAAAGVRSGLYTDSICDKLCGAVVPRPLTGALWCMPSRRDGARHDVGQLETSVDASVPDCT